MKKNIKLLLLGLLSTTISGCGSDDDTPPVQGTTDTTAPVITLLGDRTMNLAVGDIYAEEGTTVTDNIDTNLTAVVTGTVDTSIAGTYTITYTASDAAGNDISTVRTVIVDEVIIIPVEGDAYIFDSSNDDSFSMEFWGDTWDSGSTYIDNPIDTTYEKSIEITKGTDWGTAIAWGNEAENAVDISAYNVAKFKVKTATFNQVQVFVQSANSVDTEITYNLSNGTDLGNGWLEMEVALPGFTDMTWFALNFIGESGAVLLADIIFTYKEVVVNGPSEAAPTPPLLADNEAIVLYSDYLTLDSFISVWNQNWWNAPTYFEVDVAEDNVAKYQITDGGIAGGVVGLEYGFENGALDASSTTTWNFDLYVESGIAQIKVQLVSESGGATYTIDNPVTDTWVTYDILFSEMTDNDGDGSGVLNPGSLNAAGIALWGSAGQSVYLDNIYFSGESTAFDLTVTVTDGNDNPLANANVSVGNVSSTSAANGVATLHLPEGDHKVTIDAPGYGINQGNQSILGGDASLTISVSPLNAGPSEAALVPTVADEDAIVLYSDFLAVDKNISFWSDNWWNAPTFSEVVFAGNNTAKFQIIIDGVSGGITGIQYGVEDGVLDASSATGLRFDMFATSGITLAKFQLVSASGAGEYSMDSLTTGEWVTVELDFTDFHNDYSPETLSQLGLQLWGTTSDAIYLDNIYFY